MPWVSAQSHAKPCPVSTSRPRSRRLPTISLPFLESRPTLMRNGWRRECPLLPDRPSPSSLVRFGHDDDLGREVSSEPWSPLFVGCSIFHTGRRVAHSING